MEPIPVDVSERLPSSGDARRGGPTRTRSYPPQHAKAIVR